MRFSVIFASVLLFFASLSFAALCSLNESGAVATLSLSLAQSGTPPSLNKAIIITDPNSHGGTAATLPVDRPFIHPIIGEAPQNVSLAVGESTVFNGATIVNKYIYADLDDCSVTPIQVKLGVTVPGMVAETYGFQAPVCDFRYPSSLNYSDTGTIITSPLRGIYLSADQKELLYRIGSGQFSSFADNQIIDDYAVDGNYTEQQSFWIGADNSSGAYNYTAMAYSAKFMGNDYGIPVCTNDQNQYDDWSSCASNSNGRTGSHRVKIKFMGSDWIISEMTAPYHMPRQELNSSTAAMNGGQLRLAKESAYGILNEGEVLDPHDGNFKVMLSEISSEPNGPDEVHAAILYILGAYDLVVGQIQVNPGTTYTFTESGTGRSIKIHVYKTAPGFTLNARWAEMAIYSDEIYFIDGQRYNLAPSSDIDKDYRVSLLWKNRDYAPDVPYGGNSTQPDSLREIVVYRTDGFSIPSPGDSVAFINSKPVFNVTYNGADSEYPYQFAMADELAFGKDFILNNGESSTFGRTNVTVTDLQMPLIYSPDFSTPLSPGWNLVSFPLTPDDSSVEAVFSPIEGSIESVWQYDNGWQSYTPGVGGLLTDITDGKAYFIKVNSTEQFVKLDVFGETQVTTTDNTPGQPPQVVPPFSIIVNPGWNLLGFYTSSNPHTINEITHNWQGDAYTFENGLYSPASGSTFVELGSGFWLYSNTAGTYAPLS